MIDGLRKSPEGRRHVITAWDPAHVNDLALTWCHAFVQFNCRPLTFEQKLDWAKRQPDIEMENLAITEAAYSDECPKYFLDCQMYQRSADVFLGVPYNIASYALLSHIIAKLCNMIPGEYIHTFGDVHIYDNHKDQVNEQLERTPNELPQLILQNVDFRKEHFDTILKDIEFNGINEVFVLNNYNPRPAIKAELSTGMKKQ